MVIFFDEIVICKTYSRRVAAYFIAALVMGVTGCVASDSDRWGTVTCDNRGVPIPAQSFRPEEVFRPVQPNQIAVRFWEQGGFASADECHDWMVEGRWPLRMSAECQEWLTADREDIVRVCTLDTGKATRAVYIQKVSVHAGATPIFLNTIEGSVITAQYARGYVPFRVGRPGDWFGIRVADDCVVYVPNEGLGLFKSYKNLFNGVLLGEDSEKTVKSFFTAKESTDKILHAVCGLICAVLFNAPTYVPYDRSGFRTDLLSTPNSLATVAGVLFKVPASKQDSLTKTISLFFDNQRRLMTLLLASYVYWDRNEALKLPGNYVLPGRRVEDMQRDVNAFYHADSTQVRDTLARILQDMQSSFSSRKQPWFKKGRGDSGLAEPLLKEHREGAYSIPAAGVDSAEVVDLDAFCAGAGAGCPRTPESGRPRTPSIDSDRSSVSADSPPFSPQRPSRMMDESATLGSI